MDEEHSASQVSWGARINKRERQDRKDCPPWVRGADRERWTQRGLVVWQEETQHIIKITATQAIELLDDLRTDDEWPEEGITIGEPVTHIVLERPRREPETAYHNPIHLSPSQTRALVRLLERNEAPLREMCEKEVQKGLRALGRAYRLILDYGERPNKESDRPYD